MALGPGGIDARQSKTSCRVSAIRTRSWWGRHTDCRFPLARDVVLDPFGGPLVADVDVPYDENNDERADCVIEGDELVCRGVPTYYPAGTTGVRIQVGWLGTTGVLAEITTARLLAGPSSRSPRWARTSRTPPHIDLWRSGSTSGMTRNCSVKVRDRDGGDEVAILPVPEFVASQRTGPHRCLLARPRAATGCSHACPG